MNWRLSCRSACVVVVFVSLSMLAGCPQGSPAGGTWVSIVGTPDKGEYSYSVMQASDGGYFVESGKGAANQIQVWLTKLDAHGIESWSTYVGTQSLSFVSIGLNAVLPYSEGTALTASVYTSSSEYNMDLARYLPDGSKPWTYHTVLSGLSAAGLFSGGDSIPVLPTDDGGMFLLDQILDTTNGTKSVGARKLNAIREEQWRVPYARIDANNSIDQSRFVNKSLASSRRPDGHYVIYSTPPLLGGADIVEVMDLDSEGKELGFHTFAFSAEERPFWNGPKMICLDDGYVLSQYVTGPAGSYQFHVAELASDFSVSWLYDYSSTVLTLVDMEQTGDGGYALVFGKKGLTGDTSVLTVLDAGGREVFSKEYQLADATQLNSVLPTGDGYVLSGFVTTHSADAAADNTDAVVIRTDANGNT